MNDLQDFAAKTPFEFPDLIEASQKLLAMGFAADKVRPTLTAIGDAVAGLGGGPGTIDQITRALGQMQAKGKAASQEMMQLTEAGIPAWQMLADKIGVSVPEAMKLVESGAVSADTAIGALVSGMEAKFGGMMAKQSQTFSGMLSTLKDNATQAAATLTQPFFDLATKGIAGLNEIFSRGDFQSGLQNLASQISSGLGQSISWLPGTFIPALQNAGTQINTTFGPIVQGTLTALSNIFNTQIVPAMQKILPALQELANAVGPILGTALEALAKLLGLVIIDALQRFAQMLTMVANGIEPAKAAFEALKTTIQQVSAGIKMALAEIISSLGAFARQFADFIRSVANGMANLPFDAMHEQAAGLRALADGIGNASREMSGWAADLAASVRDHTEARNQEAAAVTAVTDATDLSADAMRREQMEMRNAANASKDFGNAAENAGQKAIAGASAAQQAAEMMSKVADKVRGMVEQALNPTTVDQRLQMTGNAWDEFRLRLEAVNSGTPLDQYGAAFVAQVQKMQQITGLALPDIAAKFKDFSLFANMDWLKGALESGAIDLEPIKARINEQIQQIIGQANLMKAAFNEVWAGLSQQTKIDLAGALGLTPDAANNAQQVFAAMSGQGAVTAATQTDAAAKAASALQTGLSGANTNAGNLAAALQKLPQPLSDVKPKLEDLAKLLTDKVNPPMNALSGYFKTATDGVTKLIEDLPTLNGKFDDFVKKIQDITPPLETFLKDVLRPVADTLAEMLDTTLKLVDALHDLAEALKNTKPNEQFESHSPSPFETTLKNILATMGDITSLAPNAFSRLTTPEGFGVGQNVALAGATNGGSAGRQIVFTGNIYVQNPANFDAFMEEINRRVDTIVVNGD